MQNLNMEPDKDLYENLILPYNEDFDIDIIDDDNGEDYHFLKRRNKRNINIDKAIRKVIKKLRIKIEIDNDDKKVYVYIPEGFIKKLSEDYSDINLGKRVVWRDGDYIFAVFGVEKSKLTKVCRDI